MSTEKFILRFFLQRRCHAPSAVALRVGAAGTPSLSTPVRSEGRACKRKRRSYKEEDEEGDAHDRRPAVSDDIRSPLADVRNIMFAGLSPSVDSQSMSPHVNLDFC